MINEYEIKKQNLRTESVNAINKVFNAVIPNIHAILDGELQTKKDGTLHKRLQDQINYVLRSENCTKIGGFGSTHAYLSDGWLVVKNCYQRYNQESYKFIEDSYRIYTTDKDFSSTDYKNSHHNPKLVVNLDKKQIVDNQQDVIKQRHKIKMIQNLIEEQTEKMRNLRDEYRLFIDYEDAK